MNVNTKPTFADVKAMIRSTTFTQLPSGSAIVCEITLHNMHTVHGIANVVDMENYDEDLGRKAAEAKAIDRLFELLAYDLHTKMATQEIPNKHQLLTSAHAMGTSGQAVTLSGE